MKLMIRKHKLGQILLWSTIASLLIGPARAQTPAPVAQKAGEQAPAVQRQKLPEGVLPVIDWLYKEPKYRAMFTPEAIQARSLSAIRGEMQQEIDWMWPQAAYLLLSPSNPEGLPGGVKTRIVNPAHLMANNNRSFYRYPWQAWEETVPASRISDGLGINLNVSDALLPAAIKQLKAMGMTKWRTDIGWGNGDYKNPDQLKESVKAHLSAKIAEAKKAGLRPLFCLDTNPAAPCPINEASVTLLAPLKAGDTSALVKPRSGEVPVEWKSGFSHVTQYWAAEYLATAVEREGDGYRVRFAKAWPQGKDAKAGDNLAYAYLAFRPFGNDDSPEKARTYEGFLSFVQAVQSFLETQGLRKSKASTDPGYDIEFLNENSNGHFFHLDWYAPGQANGNNSEMELYKRVVQQIRSDVRNDGMVLINGFYNQLPPQPGSREYAGSSGGSSHFYQGEEVVGRVMGEGEPDVPNMLRYKGKRYAPNHNGGVEDAFGRDWAGSYNPAMVIHSPEAVFNAYKLEHLSRVIAPIPQQLWGSVHGRGVQPRVPNDKGQTLYQNPIAREPSPANAPQSLGKPARPTRWYKTEWGDAQWGPEDERRYRIGKFVLRGTVFALSKGLERIYWYAAADHSLGLLSFDSKQLPDEEPLPVTLLKRLDSVLDGGKITTARHMPCIRISEKHGNVQFRGDRSINFPDLPNRDILFTQSFQLSDTDMAACVYVPTLNYEPDLPEETYTIRWSGVKWTSKSKAAYRDLRDRQKKSITPSAVGPDWVEFTLPVCDWPRFVLLTGV